MSSSPAFLTSRGVRARYGNVSLTWIARRTADAVCPFPEPVRYGPRGGGRIDKRSRHWLLADLAAYDVEIARLNGQAVQR